MPGSENANTAENAGIDISCIDAITPVCARAPVRYHVIYKKQNGTQLLSN